MATCHKCGTGKLRKRADGWFYCTKHGYTRRTAGNPYKLLTAPNGLGETEKQGN